LVFQPFFFAMGDGFIRLGGLATAPGFENPTNSNNPVLVTGQICVQNAGPALNGLLTVIDVDKAIRGFGQASILQTIASACSPVRVVETENGQLIWVTARGSNQVLAFDVQKLLYFPNHALVGHGDLNGIGTAPVGLALFHHDELLAVANSNRFTNGTSGITSVAILDVRDPASVTAVQTIESESKCNFPRGAVPRRVCGAIPFERMPSGLLAWAMGAATLPIMAVSPTAPRSNDHLQT
jgi:hypothetical protein